MRIQRFLGELCIFKHRASATENEHRAAQHIYQLMRSIGLVAEIDEFRSQKRMTWELVSVLLFFLIETFFYFYSPLIAVISGVIGTILFIGYFTTLFKPFAPLFRMAKSNNVIGKILNVDAPFKIILTAHYDTARSGPMWHPKRVTSFRFNFLLGLFLIFLLLLLSILKLIAISGIVFDILVVLIGIFILAQIATLIYQSQGVPVEGASDNASGVAVMLDLAARIKDLSIPEVEFWFVATGSEEVGAVGMSAFLKKYKSELPKNSTYFINFDNIGNGNLHYFTCEGMIFPVRFSKDLIQLAAKTAQLKNFKKVTPSTYKLAYTDAIVPASRGYHTILFLATDDRGMIPNWHWPTDTITNIDFKVPQLASDFAFAMIEDLCKLVKMRLNKNIEEIKQFQTELGDSKEI